MDYSPTSFKGARPLEQPIRRWLDSKIAVSMHWQQLRELNLDDQNEVKLRPNFWVLHGVNSNFYFWIKSSFLTKTRERDTSIIIAPEISDLEYF